MQEIDNIWLKYEKDRILTRVDSLEEINRVALAFGNDVANTFRLITLIRDPVRNPRGYGLSNAPIVGLLTRIAKLLQLVCNSYKVNNGYYISVFSRPLIESAIVVTYLLRKGNDAVKDFRHCSYKDVLRVICDFESGSDFYRTSEGQRVLRTAVSDLALENLSKDSFTVQKANRWCIQGKSIFEIFMSVIDDPVDFPSIYGVTSESIHGSWNESLDWSLTRNSDGTYSAYTLFVGADARLILPLVRHALPAYLLWVEKIQFADETLSKVLDCIPHYSRTIYVKFEEFYDLSSN